MTTSNINSNNGTTTAVATTTSRRARSNSILVDKSTIIGANAAASLPLPAKTKTAKIEPAAVIAGADLNLANVLNSKGPIVNAVLLKASSSSSTTDDDEMANDAAAVQLVVEDIQIDTTPKKQMVQQVLGAPITFLGQYEDEGTVLMIRRDQQSSLLNINHHKLQPPFHDAIVRGDILILKVAHEEEEQQQQGGGDEEKQPDDHHDEIVQEQESNDDFFLNYTKDEYLKFAARTDITVQEVVMNDDEEKVAEDEEDMLEEEDESDDDDEEMMEGEDDSDDEDDGSGGFMELLMTNVLQRFQEENGRMPNEQEVQALQDAIAQKLGGGGGNTAE